MTVKKTPLIPIIRDLEKELWVDKEGSSNKHVPVITKNENEYVLDNVDLDDWQETSFSYYETKLNAGENVELTVDDKTFIVLKPIDMEIVLRSDIRCPLYSSLNDDDKCSNCLFYINNYNIGKNFIDFKILFKIREKSLDTYIHSFLIFDNDDQQRLSSNYYNVSEEDSYIEIYNNNIENSNGNVLLQICPEKEDLNTKQSYISIVKIYYRLHN